MQKAAPRAPSTAKSKRQPRGDAAEAIIHDLTTRFTQQSAELESLRGELEALNVEVAERDDEIETVLTDLAASAFGGDDARIERIRWLRRLRQFVRESVARRSRVTVVSNGDEALLRAAGTNAEHLSQDAYGRFVGSSPASAFAAVAQLEAARSRGAGALLIPGSSLWWLDHYPAFRQHLDRHYAQLAHDDSLGVLWNLRQDSPWRDLSDSLSALSLELGRHPHILDWCTRHDLARRFEECNVISVGEELGKLPYLDRTIDIVAVPTDETDVVTEARRVAGSLVVQVTTSNGVTRVKTLWHASEMSLRARGFVVAVPPYGIDPSSTHLDLLLDSLPRSSGGELLVDAEAMSGSRSRIPRGWRVIPVIRPGNGAFRAQLRRLVRSSDRQVIMVVPPSVIPVPGWVGPLMHVLSSASRAGVAAAAVVGPDGGLSAKDPSVTAAGGAGTGDPPDGDGRRHVRPVTSVPNGPFAVGREVLLAAPECDFPGGAVIDAARASRRFVYYQPRSLGITYPAEHSVTEPGR
jgi:hypothetical protein